MFCKLLRQILFIAIGISAVSCDDSLNTHDNMPVPDSPGTLTIRFSNSDQTRSTESDNAEKLIDNLIIALYPNIGDETVAATVVGKFSGVSGNGEATVTMVLTEDMVKTLFNNTSGASCRMYALANIPEESVKELAENPSIKDMKDLQVSTDFDVETVPASFVMSGAGSVTYTAGITLNDPGSAEGEGVLSRAAAKIRLNLDVPTTLTFNEGTENEETWESDTNSIRVLLNSGVKTAIASPDDAWKPSDSEDYYNSNLDIEESVRTYSNTGPGKYSQIMNVPFYTYPNQWTESVEETNKTTMTLIVPWRQVGTDRFNYYYYIVPVTPTELPRLDANHSYVVNLTVGMLGSLTPANPVELEDLSYQVVNWSTENIDINIKDVRYLVVNPTNITINNEADMLIPFYSSHPVDVNNITMTFQRFNFYSNGNGEVVDIEIPKNKIDLSTAIVNGETTKMVDYEVVTQNGQSYLKVNHALEIWTPVNNDNSQITTNNTVNFTGYANGTTPKSVVEGINHFNRPTNPDAAYSAYTFKIHIQHGDKSSYYEDIVITQYPGMYIEAKPNKGGTYPTGQTSSNQGQWYNRYTKYSPTYPSTDPGSVFVNPVSNYQADNSPNNPTPQPFYYYTNDSNLGGVEGLTGGNKNPNMYVISISQLDSDSQYMIGDPRSKFYNNDLSGTGDLVPTDDGSVAGAWCNTAQALYNTTDNNRRLTYYYPTNEVDYDLKTAYMVAPKLRVASSYGVVGNLDRENARRRAATYQEQTCPSGRWRLPTLGEFAYITQLSAEGKIPTLFSTDNGNNNTRYWTAQGIYTVRAQNGKAVITRVTSSTTTTAHIRAVYDEWYWENYPQYSGTAGVYTLGDMPRTLPNNP